MIVKKIKGLLLITVMSSIFCSCINTRKAVYFNDVAERTAIVSKDGMEPIIQKNDMLSISVSSRDVEATAIFNAPNMPSTLTGNLATNMQQAAGYLVNQEGVINFPILGKIMAAGQTKKQMEERIAQNLADQKLLFNPIVNIRFLNYRVTVLGEVGRPGVVQVPSEQISILEAIGLAGDLTVFGKRNNILLIRQEGDKKIIERLDLNSSKILESPYFYLKSNDIVYVEPVKAKVASGTRSQQLLPYILSGVSIIAIITAAIIR